MSQINIIPPTSQRESYTSNDSPIFNLTYAGGSLKKNSIRIIGELQILDGADAIDNQTDIKFDSIIGMHGLFSQITSSINGREIETIQNYPLTVKAREVTNKYSWDFMSQANRNLAMQIGNDALVPALVCKNKQGQTAVQEWNPFSIAPYISVNMSDNDISGKKGNMTIRLYFNQKDNFLYGSDVTTCSYAVRNLQCVYETVPNEADSKVTMPKVFYIDQPLTSNNQQYSMSLPLVCRAVSCVFSDRGRLAEENSYQLEEPPHVQRVAFNFNDLNNAYVKYDLQDRTEYLLNYQSSWGRDQESKNILGTSEYNNLFGIGLDFGGQWVNISNQNWGMNLQSEVSSARPYLTHMIFHSVVQV